MTEISIVIAVVALVNAIVLQRKANRITFRLNLAVGQEVLIKVYGHSSLADDRKIRARIVLISEDPVMIHPEYLLTDDERAYLSNHHHIIFPGAVSPFSVYPTKKN
jgi:hypothetical protein